MIGVDEPEPDEQISDEDAATLRAVIERRATGEPVPLHHGVHRVPRARADREARACSCRATRPSTSPSRRCGGCASASEPVHVDLATGAGTIALAVADEVPEAAGLRHRHVGRGDVRVARRERRAPRAARDVRRRATCSAPLPRSACRAGGRDHAAPAVRGARRDRTSCPTRSATGSPSHTLTDQSDDGLGLVRRTVEEAPAWLRRRRLAPDRDDPDRARDVPKVFRGGGFRDVRSTKGGRAQGDARDRRPAAAVTSRSRRTAPGRRRSRAEMLATTSIAPRRRRRCEDGAAYWLELRPDRGRPDRRGPRRPVRARRST